MGKLLVGESKQNTREFYYRLRQDSHTVNSYQHCMVYLHNKRMAVLANRWESLENKNSHSLLV